MPQLNEPWNEAMTWDARSEVVVSPSTSSTLTYRSVSVSGINIFYREAGPRDAPTLLLLHGYPSSSRMFDTLLPLLADRFRLIAPDYPGFGLSDAPSPDDFSYTFDNIAAMIEKFTKALELKTYAVYMQDYGGPIGFRLALADPERAKAIIVQNAVASEDGLGPAWDVRKAYWKDRAGYEERVIPDFVSLAGARERHLGSSPNLERYNPNTWLDEFAQLSRPGQLKIQADLFWSYQTNVASYPKWQDWLRQYRPPTLVLWGKYDPSFSVDGAAAYRECVPEAEVHILDAGHFALDECLDEIAWLIRKFLGRHLSPQSRSPRVGNLFSTSGGE
jgi:pimeloyl-ACP methyl ester carboxylesterase